MSSFTADVGSSFRSHRLSSRNSSCARQRVWVPLAPHEGSRLRALKVSGQPEVSRRRYSRKRGRAASSKDAAQITGVALCHPAGAANSRMVIPEKVAAPPSLQRKIPVSPAAKCTCCESTLCPALTKTSTLWVSTKIRRCTERAAASIGRGGAGVGHKRESTLVRRSPVDVQLASVLADVRVARTVGRAAH